MKLIYFFIFAICIDLVYGLDLEISEIFPNPVGKDNDKEFIEIHNYGNLSISLKGIWLKNQNNKSFELSNFHDEIPAYSYLVFYPGFNLRNQNEKIKLIFGYEVIDEFNYNSSIEGMSWIKINNEWYVGKSSEGIQNFKNFTMIEYKIEYINKSVIKSETLLKSDIKQNKIIYIAKNLKQKKLGLYLFLITMVFIIIILLVENGRKRNKSEINY